MVTCDMGKRKQSKRLYVEEERVVEYVILIVSFLKAELKSGI